MAFDPLKIANIMAGAAKKKSQKKPKMDADGDMDGDETPAPQPKKAGQNYGKSKGFLPKFGK